MPRLLAIAAGMSFCVPSDCTACGKARVSAVPLLVTVTATSTLSRLLSVVMVVSLGSPRSAATAAVSTVGAASEAVELTVELASRVLVTVKVALFASARRGGIVPSAASGVRPGARAAEPRAGSTPTLSSGTASARREGELSTTSQVLACAPEQTSRSMAARICSTETPAGREDCIEVV